ncbi:hypothetical protein [Acetobacter sp.]|uniref:hypothetical protein n=1 Tax=Acetobacter sp. TaxID=440 RepID=UPI0039E78801
MTPTKEAIDAAVEAMRNTPVSEGPRKVAENMLRAALEVSEADTRRLDWLADRVVVLERSEGGSFDMIFMNENAKYPESRIQFRIDIDAAMKGEAA